MTAPLTPVAEVRSPLRPPLVSDRMTSATGLLAELARVSAHRSNLQDQLEAVHAARWSR